MTLAQEFFELNPKQRKLVHISLCELALAEWDQFALSKKEIKYRETVVGTEQIVDFSLPRDALESVKQGKDRTKVKHRFLEPIAAMQDYDLELPSDIQFAYYAIYNLFRKYIERAEIDDWLIVNQALSSLGSSRDIKVIFKDAMVKASIR